jgi:hypothetical protein
MEALNSMRRLRHLSFAVCTTLLVSAIASVQAADVEKYLPDGTVFVVTVNVKQLLDSPIVKNHLLDKFQAALKSSSEISEVLDSLGIDPLKDLTRFTAASTGTNPDSKGLLILAGNFDPAKFEALAKKNADRHADVLKILTENGHQVYEVQIPQSPRPLLVSVLDKNTIVATVDKESLQEAFSRVASEKPVKLKKEIEQLLQGVDGRQSLWVAMLGEALSKNEMLSDDKTKKTLEKIDTISAGITVAKDIQLLINVLAKSSEGAKDLASEMTDGLNNAKGLLALAASDKKELGPAVGILESIKVGTDGKKITVKSEVPEDVIEKSLKDAGKSKD